MSDDVVCVLVAPDPVDDVRRNAEVHARRTTIVIETRSRFPSVRCSDVLSFPATSKPSLSSSIAPSHGARVRRCNITSLRSSNHRSSYSTGSPLGCTLASTMAANFYERVGRRSPRFSARRKWHATAVSRLTSSCPWGRIKGKATWDFFAIVHNDNRRTSVEPLRTPDASERFNASTSPRKCSRYAPLTFCLPHCRCS